MPIDLNVSNIQHEISDFAFKLEKIDMESVKKSTAKRTAEAMSEMVRQAVVAEGDIQSPPIGGNSPYTRGDGPSMSTGAAWLVEQVGSDKYVVTPHPEVRQRAIVLNYGYPGRITPNSAEALRFTIKGVPVFATSVKGPDPTGYWQAAYRRMQSSDKLERIANDELEKEIDEVFR